MLITDSNTQQARSSWGGMQEIQFKITKFTRQWKARPHLWRPPTDVYETERDYRVRVEIAGMQHAGLTISLEDNLLAIHGFRQHESEHAAYHQMEVRYGEFLSLVELPGSVDVHQLSAEYDDGFLYINLPKAVE